MIDIEYLQAVAYPATLKVTQTAEIYLFALYYKGKKYIVPIHKLDIMRLDSEQQHALILYKINNAREIITNS